MRRAICFFALLGVLLAGFAVRAGSPTPPVHPELTVLIAGQSNAGGLGVPYMVWGGSEPIYDTWIAPGSTSDRIASCFRKSGEWSVLTDPQAGGPSTFPKFANPLAGASVWPLVARELLPVIGNVAFIPCDKPGSSIGSWLFVPANDTSLVAQSIQRAQQSGETVGLVFWWQGETDAYKDSATTYSQYGTRLATLAARYKADLGADLMPCKFERCWDTDYPKQAEINQAIADSWGTPNIVQGPDLSDIPTMPEDTVHLLPPSKRKLAAGRIAAAILNWYALQ